LRIVLAGAGHAHIAALRIFAKTKPRAEIILINDGPHAWYTGTLPALIRRDISKDQARLDLPALAKSCGATFIDAAYRHCEERRDEAIQITLHNHEPIQCNRLSLSIGGEKLTGGIKPIPAFLSRLTRLDQLKSPKIAIIGAGAAGIEIALALRIRLPSASIYLQQSQSGILPTAPPRAQIFARAALAAANINIAETPPDSADETIHAYTPEPRPLIRATLQLTTSEKIFATGDCAKFEPPLPRSGAIAVRQGRILAHNLTHPTPKIFRPPAATLAIMSLNTTQALAWYGKLSASGRLPMLIKKWLDKRWLLS
jgi:selenide,water dikinase